MPNPRKDEASAGAGLNVAAGREAKATEKKRIVDCSQKNIRKTCRYIAASGLALRSTATDTQTTTLPKVLARLGERGLGTYEGTAAGYLRLATRIKEIKDIWEILTIREDVIGPDGLFHKGCARYVLIGRRRDLPPYQLNLGLGDAQ
jgi:hypothetical protein